MQCGDILHSSQVDFCSDFGGEVVKCCGRSEVGL